MVEKISKVFTEAAVIFKVGYTDSFESCTHLLDRRWSRREECGVQVDEKAHPEVWDLERPFEGDTTLLLFKLDDKEA